MFGPVSHDDVEVLRRASRRYAGLLRLYPADFRRAHGDEMLEAFEAMAAEALRSGPGALRAVWGRVLSELGPTVLQEHWDRVAGAPGRSARVVFACLAPLVPYCFLAQFAPGWPEAFLITAWLVGTCAGLVASGGRGRPCHARAFAGAAASLAFAFCVLAVLRPPVSAGAVWGILLLSTAGGVLALAVSVVVRMALEGVGSKGRCPQFAY